MNIIYLPIVLCVFVARLLQATTQRDILTYINDFRHLHAGGPLISSPSIKTLAQQAAVKYRQTGNIQSAANPRYNANLCTFTGNLAKVSQTCTVAWYTTIKHHSWCSPQLQGNARPFMNMIWNSTNRIGIGISRSSTNRYYVVAYFSPKKGQDIRRNVRPVRIVTQASPKAKCTTGYTRFGSSCFKFHNGRVTWDQAVTQCSNENATLTSVRNQREEKFLRTLQTKGGGNGYMWIGLSDRLREGSFAWLDGLYFAHGVCVPVNARGSTAENCVAWTTRKPISCWSDRNCKERLPFMCRMPVEGKSVFRTEILFSKFRWNPNFRRLNSKAFRDMVTGIKVTFKEIFQRASGRIGGGLRSIKVKSVRPLSISGGRRGTAVTLSMRFRSKIADPTLKFQRFLRPSERLISVTLDQPVAHASSIDSTYCSFPCRSYGHNFCPGMTYYSTGYHHPGYHHPRYHHMGYQHTGYQHMSSYNTGCSTTCAQYTPVTCPNYCPQPCCTTASRVHYMSPTAAVTAPSPASTVPSPASTVPSTASTVPSTAATRATRAPTTASRPSPSPKPPAQQPKRQAAAHVQLHGYSSYQPYHYPIRHCHTCHTYSSPYCYAYCDESCCERNKKTTDLKNLLSEMKANLRKFKFIVKAGKGKSPPVFDGIEEDYSVDNDITEDRSHALSAVNTLERNIAKIKLKLKQGQQQVADSDKYGTVDYRGVNKIKHGVDGKMAASERADLKALHYHPRDSAESDTNEIPKDGDPNDDYKDDNVNDDNIDGGEDFHQQQQDSIDSRNNSKGQDKSVRDSPEDKKEIDQDMLELEHDKQMAQYAETDTWLDDDTSNITHIDKSGAVDKAMGF